MWPVDPIVLLAFLPAGLALNLTPGADMMFCVGQGLRRGSGAGWAASGGVALGAFFHGLLAGLGLGALVAAHPGLFDVIRWVGIGYLLWLAVASWRARAPGLSGEAGAARHAFRDGLLVNLSNPKVILFVLAFVPQFVDPARGQVLAQFLTFALMLATGGFLINGLAGAFAAGTGRRLLQSAGAARWLGRTSAAIFAALALRLAFTERA
ncbi:LysE family translocator [Pseudooceanicola sp.]|uniref:LysE family translocator n=1 Tax=Pseudooceanicola sp. TaxID=1914328 RepID=UPI0026208854|nr:LysE family translocator [Pseudooceanicola sp.]MDF1856512.1 LysE family translocator [Pseudooceanicola sp.]